MIHIIPYQTQYQQAFYDINAYWLNYYNLTETHDLEILDDPEKYILNKGGAILLALLDNEVVGTIAIGPTENKNEYELMKMGVSPLHHKKGISKLLLQPILDFAIEKGAKKIILYSNSQLIAALELYKKFGFVQVPVIDSPFITADVMMQKII